MVDYVQYLILTNMLRKSHMQVSSRLPDPGNEEIHSFKNRRLMFVKSLEKVSLSSSWKDPYQVLLTTGTTLGGREATWIHASRCRRDASMQLCSSSFPQADVSSSLRTTM